MWQDNPRIYDLEKYRFVISDEVERERELAYKQQAELVAKLARK